MRVSFDLVIFQFKRPGSTTLTPKAKIVQCGGMNCMQQYEHSFAAQLQPLLVLDDDKACRLLAIACK